MKWYLDADGEGGGSGLRFVLHGARRLHHGANHQRPQPLGHIRRQVAQHLLAAGEAFGVVLPFRPSVDNALICLCTAS